MEKYLNFLYWTGRTESKRVSDNSLKSLNFFRQRWTDLCPLCPLVLSSRCPPAVQPENKYSIYFSGEKIPYLFSGGKIPELKIPELFLLWENTGIIFAVGKYQNYFRREKNTGINFGIGKIPDLFPGWKNTRINLHPENTVFISGLENARFIMTAPEHLCTGAVLRVINPVWMPASLSHFLQLLARTCTRTCL